MEYVIVQHLDVNLLIEEVNRLINEGYEPQGGLSTSVGVSGVSSNILYTQALIKVGSLK